MGDLIEIIFNPMDKMVKVKKGTILLDAIREAGIMIRTLCGGKGDCGTCKVIIDKGEVSDLSTKHEKWLSPQEVSKGYHLACQTRVLSDAEFTIPVESRIFRPKILLSMDMKIDEIDPASKKYLAKTPLPRYECSIIELEGYSDPKPQISEEICTKLLSMKDKEYVTGTITKTSKHPEVIHVELGDRTGSNYGLAIDVGTTTIALLLVDLLDGKILGSFSGLNGQITYGETLVTRIAYASEPHGLKNLQSEVIKSINELVDKLLSDLGVKKEEVTDVCVGGNTVMNHLLSGVDPAYLAYVDGNAKVSRVPIIRKSKTLGLHVNPETYIYCLPNVSRFLGGDAIGDVLASGMYDSDDLSLLVDMGTNGEIILGNNLWLVSCSCASGPAFEGEGIKFGMRAMEGGIDHVDINPKTLEANYSVIGNTRPRGICGSGLIDAAAEMYSVGILDFAGKIVQSKSDLIRKGMGGLEYVLVPAERTKIGRDIVITQHDVDYLMDSKAATCGAVIVLMKKMKISIYDVKNFYLAGAFGSYANIENTTKFGIFPEFPNAKLHPIGNGSISGAYATLLSTEKRKQAKKIAKNILYIDLLVDMMFPEEYSAALYIPGTKEYFPNYSSRIPKNDLNA